MVQAAQPPAVDGISLRRTVLLPHPLRAAGDGGGRSTDMAKPARFPQYQSGTTVHRPCAKGCEVRGTCYAPTGRCDCPFGWAGPSCDNFTEYQPPKRSRCFAQDKAKYDCGEVSARGACVPPRVRVRVLRCPALLGLGVAAGPEARLGFFLRVFLEQ